MFPPQLGGQKGVTIFVLNRRQIAERKPRCPSFAAKAREKLIIEPILNGQRGVGESLKTKSGYATIGESMER